jgi:hypothetical protein
MRSQARIGRVDSGFRSKAEKRARRSRFARSILAAVFAAALAGCARNTPTNAAARYLANLRQHRYAACYAMLTDTDRHNRTLAEFLTEIPMGPDADPLWFRQILDVTNFQIGAEQRNGNIASVTVKVTTPDLPLWERTLDAEAGLGGSGADLAAESLKSGKFPTITYDDLIYLFKEHRRWRVVAAFTRRDHLIDQHREAAAAYREYEFTEAIEQYKSIIEQLRGLQATGAIGLAYRYEAELDQIQSAQADVPQSRKYAARYLHLSDVAMRMSEERVPAVFGSIKNRGARAIDNVQIAVTWYSGRGKDVRPVFTERHPVIVTPLEFTDFSRPVIPLLPDETRPFGFILTAPVRIQQDATPYVTIGSIVFTQSSAPLPKLHHDNHASAEPPAPGASGSAPPAAKPSAAPRPTTP